MDIEKPKVVLAFDSPLYAPIYLADALKSSHKECDVFNRIKLTTAQSPIKSIFGSDPLIDQLLHPLDSPRTIMAIGDPMRILLQPLEKGYFKPKVKYCLIDKMCYWIIDQDIDFRNNYGDHISKFIVHPAGMTAYNLMLYELVQNQNISVSDSVKKLYPYIYPGQERDVYFTWFKIKKDKPTDFSFAYVSMDPFDHKILRDIQDEKPNKSYQMFDNTDDIFNKSIMTALITRTGHNLPDGEEELCCEVAEAIKYAMQIMHTDTYKSNFYLLAYFVQKNLFFGHEPNLFVKHMALVMNFLVNNNIYRQGLDIPVEHYSNSKNIAKIHYELQMENSKININNFDVIEKYFEFNV